MIVRFVVWLFLLVVEEERKEITRDLNVVWWQKTKNKSIMPTECFCFWNLYVASQLVPLPTKKFEVF